MRVTAYHTPLVRTGENLENLLRTSLPPLREKMVVAVASKIVSTSEGRFVPKVTGEKTEKHQLVLDEAEWYLDPELSAYNMLLTRKGNWFFVNAGIDESNADNQYILWPEDLQRSVNNIWNFLRSEYNLNEVGVILTDSASMPLNWGVTGHGIAHCGFQVLKSYIRKPDLFGREMKMEQVNMLQSMAAAAVLEMGEGAEQTPLVVLDHVRDLVFEDHEPTAAELRALHISMTEDFYAPIINVAPWKKGGSYGEK